MNWLENIRDWCISRQLWWGHRLPVFYTEDGEIIVSEDDPDENGYLNGKKVTQEEDTLDTWFSSALWPFATLGWPEETEDYKYFLPYRYSCNRLRYYIFLGYKNGIFFSLQYK